MKGIKEIKTIAYEISTDEIADYLEEQMPTMEDVHIYFEVEETMDKNRNQGIGIVCHLNTVNHAGFDGIIEEFEDFHLIRDIVGNQNWLNEVVAYFKNKALNCALSDFNECLKHAQKQINLIQRQLGE